MVTLSLFLAEAIDPPLDRLRSRTTHVALSLTTAPGVGLHQSASVHQCVEPALELGSSSGAGRSVRRHLRHR
tara:strand:- start:380 stop:595 length:216 start_codon:yes stop_codon:yes gene_type:complete